MQAAAGRRDSEVLTLNILDCQLNNQQELYQGLNIIQARKELFDDSY